MMEMALVFCVFAVPLLVLYSLAAVALYLIVYRLLFRRVRSIALRVLVLVLARPLATSLVTFALAMALMCGLTDMDCELRSFPVFAFGYTLVHATVLDIVVGLIVGVVTIVRSRQRLRER
jgi:hypothetical protein